MYTLTSHINQQIDNSIIEIENLEVQSKLRGLKDVVTHTHLNKLQEYLRSINQLESNINIDLDQEIKQQLEMSFKETQNFNESVLKKRSLIIDKRQKRRQEEHDRLSEMLRASNLGLS